MLKNYLETVETHGRREIAGGGVHNEKDRVHRIGLPGQDTIAGRLISQGEELVIWNRTIEKGRGVPAELADCPKQVAQQSDVIFLNLFDKLH